MALQNITRQELEKALEDIVNVLVKKGLLPELSPTAKKELVQKVSETLIKDPHLSLTKEDLKNDKVQTTLGLCCMAELVHKQHPDYKFNYTMLFKPIEHQELQKELKLLFNEALKLQPGYKNKTEAEKIAMEGKINLLAFDMTNKLKDTPEPLLKNDSLMNIITAGVDLLSDHRRQLYGVDTQNPGEEPIPVLAVPVGDQMGFIDLATSGKNFMAERDNPDAGTPDPLSMHFSSALKFLADGQTTKYEQYLMDNNIIPSNEPKPASPTPFSMKPDPYH